MAIEAIDGRKGIDSLAQLCLEKLDADPFSGCLFLFRSRSAKAIRILAYDGQGFWLVQTSVEGALSLVADGARSRENIARIRRRCCWPPVIRTGRVSQNAC